LASTDFTGEHLVFYSKIIPAIGAFTIHALINNLLVSGVITLTQRTSLTYHLRFDVKYLLVQFLSLGVLGVLMAIVYAQSSWNLLLVLIPLGLVHVSLRSYMKLRHQTKKTFESVVEMLHARDPYTYEHSKDVAELAQGIAQALNLHQDQIEQIKSAALIHDIGKLGVPDEILRKPGPLTDEEWAVMKQHPDIGADLIKDLEIYRDIVDIVRYEHERWDGSGYPKGLQGSEIPIGARIVAAADIYHALITDRPYRPAYSPEVALQMIREMRGRALDPQVVDALLSVLEEKKEAQRIGPYPEKTASP
jgi:putative nucleotidyltransferase with HDIG domain